MIDLELRLCEEEHKDTRRMRESKGVAKLMDCKFQRGQKVLELECWKDGGVGWRVGCLKLRLWLLLVIKRPRAVLPVET